MCVNVFVCVFKLQQACLGAAEGALCVCLEVGVGVDVVVSVYYLHMCVYVCACVRVWVLRIACGQKG
jgi:hypothetical protein